MSNVLSFLSRTNTISFDFNPMRQPSTHRLLTSFSSGVNLVPIKMAVKILSTTRFRKKCFDMYSVYIIFGSKFRKAVDKRKEEKKG